MRSLNAVYPYKSNPAPPARVALELGVQYQVEGSVLRSADRIRVKARLVDHKGRVHWSGRFDEPVSDLFALQDRITRDVAGALAIHVTRIEEARALSKSAESLEAYDYVLRARSQLQRPTRAGGVEARELLKHAIEIDPASAPAYATLADTYQLSVAMGWSESPAQSLTRAEEMAHKALAINPSDAHALAGLGNVLMWKGDIRAAIETLEHEIG